MSVVFIHADTGVAFITDGSGAVSLAVGVPLDDFTVLQATLTPGLVSDADVFYAPVIAAIDRVLQAPLVADGDALFVSVVGTQSFLSPSLWVDVTVFYVPTLGWGLLPALYTDQDIFNQASTAFPLLPPLVADSDSFPAPVIGIGVRTLSPLLVADTDVFFSLFVTLVGLPGGPLQKLRSPPKILDNDVIYAFTSSKMTGLVVDVDVVRAPAVMAVSNVLPGLVSDADTIAAVAANIFNRLQPAPLSPDDAVFTPLITMILQPAFVTSGDGILSTNVGWKLFGQLLVDVEFFPAAGIRTYNELLPEVWKDEETIDTYPFFLQQVAGGIPVLPREGVLTGSIKQKTKLTGSITKRRLVA